MIVFQVAQTIIKSALLAPKTQPQTSDRTDLMKSTSPYFNNIASDLAHKQISVDLFVFSLGKGMYKNLITLSDLARNSSGNLYFYPEFNPRMHMTKFTNELYHTMTRKMAWESVFRIRLSHGFKHP